MHGSLHRRGRQAATHHPPRLAALDQACTRQHVEMLHDGRQGDRETLGDLGHRQLGLAREAIDDGAPGRVGQRREGKIELGATKLNHVVKYCGAGRRSQAGMVHDTVYIRVGVRTSVVGVRLTRDSPTP